MKKGNKSDAEKSASLCTNVKMFMTKETGLNSVF